jgi:prepilin-type N-terminal cleavage/methylation domain-containing protein
MLSVRRKMLGVRRKMLESKHQIERHTPRFTSHLSRLTPSLAFTLIEILVALSVMTLVATAAFSLLAAVSKAWQRGTELSRDLHAGDFVIEQVVGALRSARYRGPQDGLLLKKNGSGRHSEDSMSWVKEGPDLVGSDSYMSKTFHHIRFFIGSDKEGNKGAMYTAWGDEYLQPEDFDPDDLEPQLLSDRVVGLNVQVATNDFENEKIEWMDKWEGRCVAGGDLTNHLPRFVEVTLYLKPLDEGDPPLEMRRLVDIPIARQGLR